MRGMHPDHVAFVKDAPYIVDAERYGMPHPDKVVCPKCGNVCETIYAFGDEAIGCENCVNVLYATDWMEKGGKEY